VFLLLRSIGLFFGAHGHRRVSWHMSLSSSRLAARRSDEEAQALKGRLGKDASHEPQPGEPVARSGERHHAFELATRSGAGRTASAPGTGVMTPVDSDA